MCQFRFVGIAFVSFVFAISTSLLRRVTAVLLCGILGLNSVCGYSFLDWGGIATAATPPSKTKPAANVIPPNIIGDYSNSGNSRYLSLRKDGTGIQSDVFGYAFTLKFRVENNKIFMQVDQFSGPPVNRTGTIKNDEENNRIEVCIEPRQPKGKETCYLKPNSDEKPEAEKSDASEYNFSVVAKSGDTIDGKKTKDFYFEAFGMGYNLLDNDGNAVYLMEVKTQFGTGVQLFRNEEAIGHVGQKIDNVVVDHALTNYAFCRNGNLDVEFATDPRGAKKFFARNSQGKWTIISVEDPQSSKPLPPSYLSDACNIYTPSKYSSAVESSLFINKFKSTGLKIPYAKLLGLSPNTHFTDLLFISQMNAKSDVLLLVGVDTTPPGKGAKMLLLGKPKSKNRALCVAKAAKWKSSPKKNKPIPQALVDGIQHILDAIAKAGITDAQEQAYILATADHESSGFTRFSERYNIEEGEEDDGGYSYFEDKYGLGSGREKKLGNTQPGDGSLFRGHGYIQVTGRGHYTTWSQKLGQDFLKNPALIEVPDTAAQIAAEGMRDGLFTGRKLDRYLKDGTFNYEKARAIINGDVKKNGSAIANTARQIKTALDQCN